MCLANCDGKNESNGNDAEEATNQQGNWQGSLIHSMFERFFSIWQHQVGMRMML